MKTILTAAAILLVCMAGLALAEENGPSELPRIERPLSPMMKEITDLQEATHRAVDELAASLATARGNEQIMEIQREIARLKLDARVETMRIQLRYAQAEGHEEAAAKLEETITSMTTAPRPAAQVRPAPARTRK